jgi:hypothetical protein
VIRQFWRAQRSRIDNIPKLFRFLAANAAFGGAVGVALASSMVLTNAAGLNDLIAGDGHPYLTVFVLHYLFALTFAAVAMGIAIMTLPRAKEQKKEQRRDHDVPHS